MRVHFFVFFFHCLTTKNTEWVRWARAHTRTHDRQRWCAKRYAQQKSLQLFVSSSSFSSFLSCLPGFMCACVCVPKLFYSLLNLPTAIWKVGQMLVFTPVSSLISRETIQCGAEAQRALTQKWWSFFVTPFLSDTPCKHHRFSPFESIFIFVLIALYKLLSQEQFIHLINITWK